MGLLDRLFGRRPQQGAHPGSGTPHGGARQPLPDEQAAARYRHLLRTAPAEQIEQAHAEAFAQLTTDQRQQVLAQLAAAVPAAERPRTDDAATLARVATQVELREPGRLERALGGYGPDHGAQPGYGGGYGGPGMGGMIGGSLLGTIGGLVIGTAVADALFDVGGGDFSAGDYGGGDFGGGDFGGDFGGGDF